MRCSLLILLATACSTEDDLTDNPTFAESLTEDALMGRLADLEAIAEANAGNRMFLSGGYDSSVDYVVEVLEDAGYVATVEPFELASFELSSNSVSFVDEGPGGPEVIPSEAFEFSGSTTITAHVTAVDVVVPAADSPNTSTSGCEASDFDAFPAGDIALIQRGTCTFTTKATLAADAGAVAVIVFNEGQQGRRDVVAGQLDAGAVDIPVVGISYASGRDLALGPDVSLTVSVDADTLVQTDHNVFAHTAGGDPNRQILIGAHLDGVEAGPGINDNGSGSAFVLELAVQMAEQGIDPANQVHFAWWGAEEEGLLGSQAFFFDDLGEPDSERLAPIDAYLNFDMLASGNGARMIYDGDGSDFRDGVDSDGSALIESLFEQHFAEASLLTTPEALLIPSDSYWPALIGIPTGGLFSGAFGIKTEAEEASIGGDAGDPRDPCYHQACDTVENTNPQLFTELARAGAAVALTLAQRENPMPAGRGRRRAAPLDLPRPRGCHDHAVWDR